MGASQRRVGSILARNRSAGRDRAARGADLPETLATRGRRRRRRRGETEQGSGRGESAAAQPHAAARATAMKEAGAWGARLDGQ